MKTKMIAYVTAGAIAVSGMSATSAQANNQELFNFIAGATFLAIIASGLQNGTVTTTTNTHQPHRVKRHNRKPPKNCLRQRQTSHGWKKYYAHKCLAKKGYQGSHPHW